MNLPPWYRDRRRLLAEAMLTIDLSRTSGIGPLKPGLSVMWDMTPILSAADPDHRMRLTVDAKGRTLRIARRGRPISSDLDLLPDTSRIGAPLRALCSTCLRRSHRLYLYRGLFRCGKCLRVTYASGQRELRDRALVRKLRLQKRLAVTERLPRHRGRRNILAKIDQQNVRLCSSMPARLLNRFNNT